MKSGLLARLRGLRDAREAVAVVTRIDGGEQALVGAALKEGNLELDAALLQDIRARLHSDTSGMLGERLFVRVYTPPRRLLIIGAVHIAQELLKLAPVAGFAASVIDPRTGFATPDRFPAGCLIAEWPDQALQRLAPDRRTGVVALSHDPKIDDPALLRALNSAAFYIGALGSRKTHAARRERLAAAGATAAQLDRIHAPIGLPLGGRSPGEIAVSIIAEAVQLLYAVRGR